MDKGADPNEMSTSGFTPLIVAAAGGHLGEYSVTLARVSWEERWPGLIFYCYPDNHTEVVKKLVSANAEINAVHPEGVNALMYAAAGGHLPVVAYLIQNGAEVGALDILLLNIRIRQNLIHGCGGDQCLLHFRLTNFTPMVVQPLWRLRPLAITPL